MYVTTFRIRRGRYSLHLPKKLAEAMNLQGGEGAAWEVAGRRALLLRLEEPEKARPTPP